MLKSTRKGRFFSLCSIQRKREKETNNMTVFSLHTMSSIAINYCGLLYLLITKLFLPLTIALLGLSYWTLCDVLTTLLHPGSISRHRGLQFPGLWRRRPPVGREKRLSSPLQEKAAGLQRPTAWVRIPHLPLHVGEVISPLWVSVPPSVKWESTPMEFL